jgi:ribonucleoside-diphosphate reductase alpha chain
MSLREQLSEERKDHQARGLLPKWVTTDGWGFFKQKYLHDASSYREQIERICRTAAKHTDDPDMWEGKFFELFWNGWLSPSTPVLANMGTTRGLPVSCSGGYIEDSIFGFYSHNLESALLTKEGFGTSGYLGDIRHRGSPISIGGTASGSLPVFSMLLQTMRDVAQGTARRGAWAGYIEIDHNDFDEIADYVKEYPDDANIGWNITDKFVEKLNAGDEEAIRRYQKVMKLKLLSGKGYFFFPDKVNRANPETYKKHGLSVKASNLCSEITLHSDESHTFTCVLSSMNLAYYDEWKDTDAVFNATIFLDCVASEFIALAKNKQGLEKAVRFTEKGRALGLGVMGLHSYFQKNMIPFESFEAHMKNMEIFKHIHDKSLEASAWMAKQWGEPEWCSGFGIRNTHRTAIAPTMSTATLMGGASQGIEPFYGNCFVKDGAGGSMEVINPQFYALMKSRNKYSRKLVKEIADKYGSVQHLDWLTDHEKLVFKTAFEINQEVILRLAATRQKYICQSQSLNLFFDANESEEYISQIHQMAFLDERIKSLYYVRTQAGVAASKGECLSCQ